MTIKETTITVDGPPIAQKRPRFFRRGNGVGTFNPQEAEAGQWVLCAKPQIKEKICGPVSITVTFAFARPKGHFGTGKNSHLLKPSAPEKHTAKPDLDNCVKFVKDCLRNLAFEDDSCVVEIIARKIWGLSPFTTVVITKKEDV